MDLVREYRARQSEPAFETLVRRHLNLVYSTALRQIGNPAQAEEITQAVFIILARKAARLRPNTVLAAWLHETARYVSASFLRGELRRRRREQEAYMQSTLQTPSDGSPWEQLAPQLDEAIGRLRSDERDVVLLRYFQNQSAREIAAALNIGEAAAQKRLTRAVERLRLDFFQRGIDVSTVALSGAVLTNAVQAAPAHLTASVLAAAKGTAASTSTLTLVKGALNIMAWTKTKTAATVAVVVVLGVSAPLLTIKAIHANRAAHLTAVHDIQGTWEGNMLGGGLGVNRGESARGLTVLKLVKRNGDYVATADLIDYGRKDAPVVIDYAYPSLRLSFNPDLIMEGRMNANDTRLDFGSFTLERTNAPDLVPTGLTEDAFRPRPGSDLQGYWKGTIDVKPDALPLNWKIAEAADGTFRAELDNPNQGAMGQPATVIYHRPTVQFILTSRNGMVQGEISRDNTEIKGSWIQGGKAIPASFKRADYEADHAQDLLKTYSFQSRDDLQGHWETIYAFREKPVKYFTRLDLEIARMPDGSFSAAVSSLYHLGNDGPRPASDFQYAAPDLKITWKWMNDRFEGQLKHGKLAGNWINGNRHWPVVFERKQK
jgi:RNA polymerase sigma factor (sigma-70 family)